MDAKSKNSPIQTWRTMRKRNAADKCATKEGDQIAVAPTVTVAFAKAELLKGNSEMNMYKLRVENLEEKVEALTKDRDFLRTQLSDGLKKLSQRHYTEDHERGETSKSIISLQDSGSHCSDLDSSDSSLDRKKRRKFHKEFDSESDSESDSSDSFVEKKKRKLKKKGKEKKSKKEGTHHYRQRVLGIFQKGKTMAEAFNKFGVDRNTISQTSEIAELAIAAPEKYAQLVQQVKGSKLSDIAKQCKEAVEANKATSDA